MAWSIPQWYPIDAQIPIQKSSVSRGFARLLGGSGPANGDPIGPASDPWALCHVKRLPTVSRRDTLMIKSFRHGGLGTLLFDWLEGRDSTEARRAPAASVGSAGCRGRAGRYGSAGLERFHALKGALKGYFAVWVDENWRLTFLFEAGHAEVVDYQDYH